MDHDRSVIRFPIAYGTLLWQRISWENRRKLSNHTFINSALWHIIHRALDDRNAVLKLHDDDFFASCRNLVSFRAVIPEFTTLSLLLFKQSAETLVFFLKHSPTAGIGTCAYLREAICTKIKCQLYPYQALLFTARPSGLRARLCHAFPASP